MSSQPEIGLNVNILEIETAQNIYQITNNWNICTNEWLKDHIYKRSIILGFKKQHSTYITNIVSALWHGFYPGYIITFVTGGMLTELGRLIRSQIRPYFLLKNETNFDIVKQIYDIICLFMVTILMAYTTVPFQVFGFWETYAIWYNLYFVGHILMGIAVVLLFIESTLNKNKIE
jgi:lysophospholipid acyltransferase